MILVFVVWTRKDDERERLVISPEGRTLCWVLELLLLGLTLSGCSSLCLPFLMLEEARVSPDTALILGNVP